MSNVTTIYLDHAASTPPLPAVCDALSRSLAVDSANPGGAHEPGRTAAARLDAAADEIACALNIESDAIIWTSGATESIHLALIGVIDFYKGGHVAVPEIEHRATLDVVNQLARRPDTDVTRIGVNGSGCIALDELEQALASGASLVSVAHVNNETGVIAPLIEIGRLCAHYDALLHVDAAQSVGRTRLDAKAVGASLVSVSGHKIGGPKGIGALYVQPGIGLTPQLRGGGQQAGRRGGTEPTHQIVALGTAVRMAVEAGEDVRKRLETLSDRLWRGLAETPGVRLNGADAPRQPGFVNVSVEGVYGEALLVGLTAGRPGLAVSPGSACSAASNESSHVLRAMGHTPSSAAASVRFSLGWTTDEETVDHAIALFSAEVARLRALAEAV